MQVRRITVPQQPERRACFDSTCQYVGTQARELSARLAPRKRFPSRPVKAASRVLCDAVLACSHSVSCGAPGLLGKGPQV